MIGKVLAGTKRMGAADAAANLPDETGMYRGDARYDGFEPDDDRNSIASVAQKAQDAAKNFFKAGYAAMVQPRDDLTLDTRELLEPVGTQIERATAAVKLESMSHSAIVVTLSIVYASSILALLVSIAVAILSAQSNINLQPAMALFGLEGVARTLATALTLFLLFAYSFRILRYTARTGTDILPEQLLLIIFMFLIMVTPSFSIYGPIVFWQNYQVAHQFVLAQGPVQTEFINLTQGDLFSFFFFTSNGDQPAFRTVNSIFTILVISFGVIYIGTTNYFFGKPVERAKKQSQSLQGKGDAVKTHQNEPQDIEAQSITSGTQPLLSTIAESDTEAAEEAEEDVEQQPEENIVKTMMSCSETFYEFCYSLKLMIVDANKKLFVLVVIYLVMSLVLVLYYAYLPSQVPFVGMISVLKVCPTVQQPFSRNLTQCNPALNNGVPFSRAMSVTGQFIVEFILAFYVHRISLSTRMKLKSMPYENNRSKHLGFRYFGSNKRMIFAFILISSIIIVASQSSALFEEFYITRRSVAGSPNSFTFNATYSPLSQVGINVNQLGFGTFYLLLSCFLFAVANAYLPPDSVPGARGFCCGGHIVVHERDLDHPAYILRETDVVLLQKCRQEALIKMRRRQRRELRKQHNRKSTRFFGIPQPSTPSGAETTVNNLDGGGGGVPGGSAMSSVAEQSTAAPPQAVPTLSEKIEQATGQVRDTFTTQYEKLSSLLRPKTTLGDNPSFIKLNAKLESLPPICEQMNANLFCLETEILLLNFSFMAYNFGSYTDEKPMSDEDKQLFLDSCSPGLSRFKLICHLENATTDIQCCVFQDREQPQRIYVSFRGTSTSKNVWQDLDYLQITHPTIGEVEPLVTQPDSNLFAAASAKQIPKVHRGFFQAYLSIRDAVHAVISDIIDGSTDGVMLFVCGHSLGGALATHFSADIGMKYKVLEGNLLGLQCSTFGSPRPGNFSYVCRHRRVVPTTHRFVIAGDPVPKLPPAQAFAEMTKWGYHHVGVEILLDVERVNLLLGPLFIERQIQHGWGGYVPKNHVTGSYVLALALWCARVHGKTGFIADWWLPVVNHVLKTERSRLRRILDVKPILRVNVNEQLDKEGAIMWTDDLRAFQNRGCDSSIALEQERHDSIRSRPSRKHRHDEPPMHEHDLSVEVIETILASCGILSDRTRRAEILHSNGFSSLDKLSRMTLHDFRRLNEGLTIGGVINKDNSVGEPTDKDKEAFDDDFIKLFQRSLSANRCKNCDFAPLMCPRCDANTQSLTEV